MQPEPDGPLRVAAGDGRDIAEALLDLGRDVRKELHDIGCARLVHHVDHDRLSVPARLQREVYPVFRGVHELFELGVGHGGGVRGTLDIDHPLSTLPQRPEARDRLCVLEASDAAVQTGDREAALEEEVDIGLLEALRLVRRRPELRAQLVVESPD